MKSNDAYLFGKRSTLWAFCLFVLMMVFDFADRMIMASRLPLIKAEWGINDTQAGLLNSALFIGMILFSFPAALAIDRWSRVKTAALMGAFWSLASGAGAFTQTLTQLATTRAAVGCAQAGYSPAAAAWIMAAFPKRRVQFALGTFSAGQPIGMATSASSGPFAVSQELVRPGIRALSMTCFALSSHLLGSVPGPALTGLISDYTTLKFALLCAAAFSGILAMASLYLAKRNYLNDLGNLTAAEFIPALEVPVARPVSP